MANVTKADVDNLCALARLGISEQERETLRGDLDGILKYVSRLEAIDVSDIESRDILNENNIMRSDDRAYVVGQFTQKIIDQAPQSDGMYVKVQKILPSQNS